DPGKSPFPSRRNLGILSLNTRAMKVITRWWICSVGLARRKKPPKKPRSRRSEFASEKKRRLNLMRRKSATVIAGVCLFLAAVPVWAHHAFDAEFDAKKPVKFRGTVTKMEWINPHAWIHIDVKGDDGKVVNWMIEAAAPDALLRRGWKKTSLLAGTEILVDGFKAKKGANRAKESHIKLTDGNQLFLGARDDGARPQ